MSNQNEKPETRYREVKRKPDGTFAKGVSGCPGGRPNDATEIINLARIDCPEAYEKVRAIMRNDEHRQQLPAALAILKLAGVLRASETPSVAVVPVVTPSISVSDLEQLASGPGRGNIQ